VRVHLVCMREKVHPGHLGHMVDDQQRHGLVILG
jgi:hypothetical protein